MLLMRYFGKRKMELLCQKIELTTGIQLKTTSQWLINQERLEKPLELGDAKASTIIFIITSKTEALNLCTKGFRFRRAPKVV